MNYWDTSCVLKLYTAEPDSATYLTLAGQATEPLVSSEILGAELYAALCQKELRGELKNGAAERLHKQFDADCAAGRWLLIPLGRDVLTKAIHVTKTGYHHRRPVPLRTLDAIHLATALLCKASQIVTTDERMQQAAAVAGLPVFHAGATP
jgi:predicted nucleic acid-binding protein